MCFWYCLSWLRQWCYRSLHSWINVIYNLHWSFFQVCGLSYKYTTLDFVINFLIPSISAYGYKIECHKIKTNNSIKAICNQIKFARNENKLPWSLIRHSENKYRRIFGRHIVHDDIGIRIASTWVSEHKMLNEFFFITIFLWCRGI